jgi:hypothetical protein
MRIESVALKDHSHVPFARRKLVHNFAVKKDLALVLGIQPSDDIEQGALATTRGPKKNAELTVFYLHTDV